MTRRPAEPAGSTCPLLKRDQHAALLALLYGPGGDSTAICCGLQFSVWATASKVLISRYLARGIWIQEALHGPYVKACIAGQDFGRVSPLGDYAVEDLMIDLSSTGGFMHRDSFSQRKATALKAL